MKDVGREFIVKTTNETTASIIEMTIDVGQWLAAKALAQAKANRSPADPRGIQHAARNLKKQGVPVELAVSILARRIV